ncbi:MAG: hypothetical protein EXR72_19420 [Myxococcales bacterium]|nr:hypothetical protein [Myxococcales bacterium]
MTERELLHELHLALEGAVEQLGAAHRLAVGQVGAPTAWAERIDRLFSDAIGVRNEVRDNLLNALGRPT